MSAVTQSTMELQATMALDRDAVNTVLLRLLPPSTAATSATAWLLLHTVPITASLSRTLSRLVTLEQALCASATHEQAPTSVSRRGHRAAPSLSSSSSSSSLDGSMSAASASPPGCIEVVRVSYIVSEIHAYCLLLRCRSPDQAVRMKAALEEGAALGVTAPVEFVSDATAVTVTRRSFADGAEKAAETSPRESARGGGSAGQQWHCEQHTTTLLDAVTAIYPVRDGDGVGDEEWREADGGSSWPDRPAHRSYAPSLYPQAMRPPQSGQAMSASASPSLQQQQQGRSPTPSAAAPSTPSNAAGVPRGRSGVSKGAAPRAGRLAFASMQASASPPAPRYARAHTPLHLPHACGEGAAVVPGCPQGGSAYDEFCAICQVDPLSSGACVMTLCQHVFHLHCYAQLPSSSAECPLCRFSVYELLNDARCEVCGTYEDLWVCLVCGHVACGRGRRDHQQEHYRSSGHSCSLHSSTNRVWNLSSHMFLHQEVALLLDGDDDAADAGAAMDRLRCMSWAEPLDEDLQEALKESKEEAVAQYYTELLRQLAEEQRRYYETRQAELRVRRERREWHRAALTSPPQQEQQQQQPLLAQSWSATVHGILHEERRQRRRLLAEYVPAMVDLLQEAQRAYTTMYNTLKAARDDAQQQVLLRSHFNSGLVAQMEQLRQRTHEAVRKGERSALVKAAEEAALQKKVEDALAAL